MSAHLIGNLHRPGEDLLDVVQPASRLQVGQPPLVLDVGEAHVLDLAQALPHHVDVVDVQEDKLGTLIVIFILISSSPTDNIEIEIIQIYVFICLSSPRHISNSINLWSRIINVNPDIKLQN